MSKLFEQSENWTNRDHLFLAEAFVRRWGELVLEDLRQDIEKLDSLNAFDQVYLRAYWWQLIDGLVDSGPGKVSVPCTTREEFDKQTVLIERQFGVTLDPNRPTPSLKADVATRLARLKERLAQEFESGVKGTIAAHEITSPIEQIFLMEWRFARVEERFRLQLRPQQTIRTDAGTFALDYCITAIDNPTSRFSVAIELDGHEFHEKTAEQVRCDKRRERAILRAGVPNGLVVFRFSGSEIYRDCSACIRELVEYIEQRAVA
jgi:very-short-patch-repair endonuclease